MTVVDRSKPLVFHSEKPEDATSEFFYTLIYHHYENTSDDGKNFYTAHSVPILIEIESASKHINQFGLAKTTDKIPIVRECLKKGTSFVGHFDCTYCRGLATCEDALVFRVREMRFGFGVVKKPSDDEIREFRKRYSSILDD